VVVLVEVEVVVVPVEQEVVENVFVEVLEEEDVVD
jgi:hypothetical protein